MVADCCIILYNMIIKSRRINFMFKDLHKREEDVVMDEAMESDIISIFIEDNNQVDIV